MRKIVYLFIVAVSLFVFHSCINDDNPKRTEVVHIGDTLPDFSVEMNDGSIVTAEELRKSVSVVVFFHTSCPDCQQLLPQMQPLYDEYSTKGVAFALISREESEGTISVFWESHNLTMLYSPQKDRAIYNLFATSLIPRVYVSDGNGVVRSIFTDTPVPSYEEVKTALDRLL